MNLYGITLLLGLGLWGCSQGTKTDDIKDVSSSSSTRASSDSVCSQMALEASQNTSFSLALALAVNNPYAAFEQAADAFVSENLDPHLSATSIGSGVQIQGNVKIRDYQLSAEGVPFCSNTVSVYDRPNHQLWMTGKIPKVQGVSQAVFDSIASLVYPSQDSAVSSIYTKLQLEGPISAQKTDESCLIFESGAFTPALKVSFVVNRKPYMGLVTTEGYSLVASDPIRSASTKTGTATVAVSGGTSSTSGSSETVYATKTVQLTGLSAGGSLCSAQFQSLNLSGNSSSPVLAPFASSPTENFTYPQSNPEFFAATTFYNASAHVAWLLKNGYISKWPGPQVEIVLNTTDVNDDDNNGINDTAVYMPNGNSLADPPQIELGNGDGVILQNLWTDPDAVQHETGHHMVYTRVTDIGNSISVTIHEGYADGQVLLQNQSPCLCSTVCPTGGDICLSNQCLRSAANNFTFAAPDCPGADGTLVPPQCLPTEVHQRSQAISGMFWDISQDIGPQNDGYKKALQLELSSIQYLTASAEYDTMLEAIIKADEDLFDSKYQSYILQEMCARGFNNAENSEGTGTWMSGISVPYTCAAGSGLIPTGGVTDAPLTSGAVNIPTTATGGQ